MTAQISFFFLLRSPNYMADSGTPRTVKGPSRKGLMVVIRILLHNMRKKWLSPKSLLWVIYSLRPRSLSSQWADVYRLLWGHGIQYQGQNKVYLFWPSQNQNMFISIVHVEIREYYLNFKAFFSPAQCFEGFLCLVACEIHSVYNCCWTMSQDVWFPITEFLYFDRCLAENIMAISWHLNILG